MNDQAPARTFRLAPMSPVVLTVTLILLALPIGFYVAAFAEARFHTAPCFIVIAFYMWIWLRFRPTRFVMHKQALEVIWPLKRQEIPLHSISSVRLLDREALKQEIGWGLRLGAGGLGGGLVGYGRSGMASCRSISLAPMDSSGRTEERSTLASDSRTAGSVHPCLIHLA